MGKLAMFGAALAFAALLFNTPGASAAASEQMETLNRAAITIDHMKSDPAFEKARTMMKDAKAVLVVPRLVKGGFIFGAEGGNGVLMKKNGAGWSSPAFYTLGSASFGLQAGLEQAEVVMLIMSDRALDAVTRSEFKIGAGLGLTMVNLSAGAEAATPPNLSGDIIIWTSAKGLYGGLTLNGSIVKPRDDWNTAFYGRRVQVSDILADRVRSPIGNPIGQHLASL
jgi:lipid-binding SYLF domain-containing protein